MLPFRVSVRKNSGAQGFPGERGSIGRQRDRNNASKEDEVTRSGGRTQERKTGNRVKKAATDQFYPGKNTRQRVAR